DLLFVKKKFRTKKDVLDFLADDYLKKKLVTTKFKHSLFEREELGSTGLKTGVAIPHADPHTVKETKLAFLTLDAPITWGDTKIQLIVLLAIAEENMIEAKELIASIYGLFNSAEEIQWIVNSQTQEELYQRLLRGGN
ncbi:PTS sugar transporter subunit IIA, partial [Enterococcus casseliflavus]|nr:PTS sugar transporter subunit IIA [Enterococcus casseliflavus]